MGHPVWPVARKPQEQTRLTGFEAELFPPPSHKELAFLTACVSGVWGRSTVEQRGKALRSRLGEGVVASAPHKPPVGARDGVTPKHKRPTGPLGNIAQLGEHWSSALSNVIPEDWRTQAHLGSFILRTQMICTCASCCRYQQDFALSGNSDPREEKFQITVSKNCP